MKAKVLINIFLIVLIVSVAAQENDTNYNEISSPKSYKESSYKEPSYKESIIKYGLKFGFDMQPITVKPQEMIDQLEYGYQGGLFLQIGRSFYLQPEVYYASFRNPTGSITTEKIQSIRTPILLGLRLIDIGIVSAHIMGGPVFSASLAEISEGMTLSEINKNWQVGVGVDILGFITADVRYSLINGVEFTDQLSYFNLKSSMLNVTVGIKLK